MTFAREETRGPAEQHPPSARVALGIFILIQVGSPPILGQWSTVAPEALPLPSLNPVDLVLTFAAKVNQDRPPVGPGRAADPRAGGWPRGRHAPRTVRDGVGLSGISGPAVHSSTALHRRGHRVGENTATDPLHHAPRDLEEAPLVLQRDQGPPSMAAGSAGFHSSPAAAGCRPNSDTGGEFVSAAGNRGIPSQGTPSCPGSGSRPQTGIRHQCQQSCHQPPFGDVHPEFELDRSCVATG